MDALSTVTPLDDNIGTSHQRRGCPGCPQDTQMKFSTPTGCPNFPGCPNGCPNYPVVCAFDILIYIITLSTVHILVPFTGLLKMYLKFYFLLV